MAANAAHSPPPPDNPILLSPPVIDGWFLSRRDYCCHLEEIHMMSGVTWDEVRGVTAPSRRSADLLSSLRRPHAQSPRAGDTPDTCQSPHHLLAGQTTGDQLPVPRCDHSLWPGIITQGQWDSPPLLSIVCIPSLGRDVTKRGEKLSYKYKRGRWFTFM